MTVEGLAEGEHGIHVHAIGVCDPTGEQPFISAGPHYNPTGGMHDGPPSSEEVDVPGGDPMVHAGDLGNVVVDAAGAGSLEATTTRYTPVRGTAVGLRR